MPDSPIRKLAPFASAAKKGKRSFTSTLGSLTLKRRVALDAVRQDKRTVIEYSPSEGFATYREGWRSIPIRGC